MNDKKNKTGRPKQRIDMVSWSIFVKKTKKEAVRKELRRLGISDSEHLENMLTLIDLKNMETKKDYYKSI